MCQFSCHTLPLAPLKNAVYYMKSSQRNGDQTLSANIKTPFFFCRHPKYNSGMAPCNQDLEKGGKMANCVVLIWIPDLPKHTLISQPFLWILSMEHPFPC